ncbi:MAG TPA: glycosyltransferase [Longimicrobium sp.]|jgi:cellulose synthase/poly-beta-1,6-N-acetylglucosamine synthase-like glycosyltransferase
MQTAACAAIAFAFVLAAYAYAGYPLLLLVCDRLRRRPAAAPADGWEWPRVSISLPAYNEEREIAATLEGLLALDYPADRLQVVVVSDASTDRTDEIVRTFAGRGVELVRTPGRRGKTAAEDFAAARLTGEIVVNTDASIRVPPGSLKALVAAFADPSVGLASGRDVSVARLDAAANSGEGRYVGYEMWVRRLETRAGGIVGASGCFYAIRAALHRTRLPEGLSRDFAAALVTRDAGYRAVSVDEAVCLVPRTASLRREYRRKVRTMARGMATLSHLRRLLDPVRHGRFAWMLFSHKVCRWAVPWAAAAACAGVLVLAATEAWARGAAALGLAALAAAAAGAAWPEERKLPRPLAVPTYLVMGNVAALEAGLRALRGERNAVWEPTRREPAAAA